MAAIADGADVNAPDENGETPLTRSVSVGEGTRTSARLVECLLSRGALVENENSKAGLGTSVHRAARSGNVEVLRILLGNGGGAALSMFDDLGLTPLAAAVLNDSLESAQMLVDAGSPLDVRDEEMLGDPALTHAVRAHNVEMVKLLLDAGSDPLVPGWLQLPALEVARDEDDDHHTNATCLIRKMVEDQAYAKNSPDSL